MAENKLDKNTDKNKNWRENSNQYFDLSNF